MDSRAFLGLREGDSPQHWRLPVTPEVSTAGGFLFGGAALAAALTALESASGRSTIWSTAQYLSYAKPGEVLEVDVNLAVAGHQMTQARAVCHVGEREILTVNAALGNRPFDRSGQWETMPDVPPPDALPPRPLRAEHSGTIAARLEQRMVELRPWEALDGSPGSGRSLLWSRLPNLLDVDGPSLAILGDFVPLGVGQALGIHGGGNSLDNTLRVVRPVPTRWVLLDIRVHAVQRGFGHGLVHMFAEDGTLLATASQSCIVRYWNGSGASQPGGSTRSGRNDDDQ